MTPGLEFTSEFTLAESGFPYGSQVTMVEVDRGTGEVKILRQFAVHDQGNIMNPTLVEGQHQGGIAQGIGQAITEEMAYDSDGQPLASTFMDYGMPCRRHTQTGAGHHSGAFSDEPARSQRSRRNRHHGHRGSHHERRGGRAVRVRCAPHRYSSYCREGLAHHTPGRS